MKLFALAAGVLGVPIENDYVPLPMVIGGTQVCVGPGMKDNNDLCYVLLGLG